MIEGGLALVGLAAVSLYAYRNRAKIAAWWKTKQPWLSGKKDDGTDA